MTLARLTLQSHATREVRVSYLTVRAAKIHDCVFRLQSLLLCSCFQKRVGISIAGHQLLDLDVKSFVKPSRKDLALLFHLLGDDCTLNFYPNVARQVKSHIFGVVRGTALRTGKTGFARSDLIHL